VDVLHRDEVLARGLTDVVNLDDVLMVKVGDDARLVEKHPDEALVLGVLGTDPLEHDVTLETLDSICTAEKDVRHSPRRKVLEHHITAETRFHIVITL
jgi:hypothetical protein